jgi:outer membrane protein OmpA-like peptidoglycan-associated protein
MIEEDNSLSWIGFTDLFLHLFIFFLAGFMLLKYFAAIELERARAAEENNRHLMAQFESCGQQKTQIEILGETCQNQLEETEKSSETLFKNLMLCRQQKNRLENTLQQVGGNLQQCQIALTTTIEQVDKTKKREELRVAFGQIITQALSVLERLKTKMESNLPIHIDRRPDRLFFDMGVSFPFNQTRIPAQQRQILIDISKTFRDILDSRVSIKKPNGQPYYLREIMQVVVEGHADYKRSKHDKLINYRISKERAFKVMQLLMDKGGIVPPKYKMSMAGFAEYGRQPKLNKQEKQDEVQIRRRMRRVTISIVPDYDVLLSEFNF